MKSALSAIELSFWYEYKYDPSSDAQNIIHRLVIKGAYSDTQVNEALTAIVRKHVILRSNFWEENGTPYRIVNQKNGFEFVNGDALDDASIIEHSRKPFALENDGLVRVIAKRNTTSTTLFITIPHIIFDAFSWAIFTNDFIHALKKNPLHEEDILPAYPTVQKNAQSYWKNRLAGIEGRVGLEHRTPLNQESATLDTLKLPDQHALFERLAEFGRQHGLSMNTLCMAFFSLTLSKLTDTHRMILATPVTTREEEHMHHIGSYINVLPTVIESDISSSFLDYAQTIATSVWDDIENRNLSLIDILRSAQTTHYDDGRGVYNVMAEYVPSLSLHSEITEDEIIQNNCAKLDIIFSVLAQPDDHIISLEYNASKLSRRYIEIIAQTFIHITTSALDDPGQDIQTVQLVTHQEKEALLRLGRGPVKAVQPPYVWNRFRDIALKEPGLVAVTDSNTTVTYGELLTISQKYAGLFSTNNIGKNTVVGIHMDRSADYIASMLALWSLGAVYVPLDPQQPPARLKSMVRQADIEVVVTRGEAVNTLDTALHLDILEAVPSDVLESSHEPNADDTAYIIFTSGSTGTPKGVVIEHVGFLNHLEIMIEEFSIGRGDVIAQTAPPSFDISVWQFIGALMVGASIVVIERSQLIDPDEMYRIIKNQSVTVLEVVPSLISGYLSNESSRPDLAGQLKDVKIITTGEPISGAVVSQWMAAYPTTPLHNAYGPAEGSDDTHMYVIKKEFTDPDRPIPIGRPLQNVHTYIVNQDMQLVPAGIVGEICIGGPVVAAGYINDSDMTNRAFLSNPMPDTAGRLYRTGDYGKWNEDETLSYHGRRDQQVKVRGQRLEIGEIEDQLRRIDGIADAAVIASAGKNGTKLSGYIVANDHDITTDSIRTKLQLSLPEFMIPQTIEILDQLQRGVNGKLDRKALENRQSQATAPLVAPSKYTSASLEIIMAVYGDVLEANITQTSNYFDCGGDSLQSMRISALLAGRGITVGIRDILLYQTPLELATHIDSENSATPVDTSEWQALSGFTPIQHAYLESAGDTPHAAQEIQATLLSFDTQLNPEELRQHLVAITKAHDELKPLDSSHPLVIENTREDDSTAEQIVEQVRDSVSLENPLVGCILSGNRLLLVAHHFVLDFYSWQQIESELRSLVSHSGAPSYENTLKRWWGNAVDTISADPAKLKDAQNFWKPSKTPTIQTKTQSSATNRHLIECELTPSFIESLHKSAVTIETFAYYAYTLAAGSLQNTSNFTFTLESSLRTFDTSNTLLGGVGWMTYTFPQSLSVHAASTDALLQFHRSTTESLRRGYEYGLLRYIVCPEYFNNEQPPIWSLNYLGSTIAPTATSKIIRTTPRKSTPFVEVDIHYDNSRLLFEHHNNIGLDTPYFEAISNEIRLIIEILTDAQTSPSRKTLSDERSATILARLNNANRN